MAVESPPDASVIPMDNIQNGPQRRDGGHAGSYNLMADRDHLFLLALNNPREFKQEFKIAESRLHESIHKSNVEDLPRLVEVYKDAQDEWHDSRYTTRGERRAAKETTIQEGVATLYPRPLYNEEDINAEQRKLTADLLRLPPEDFAAFIDYQNYREVLEQQEGAFRRFGKKALTAVGGRFRKQQPSTEEEPGYRMQRSIEHRRALRRKVVRRVGGIAAVTSALVVGTVALSGQEASEDRHATHAQEVTPHKAEARSEHVPEKTEKKEPTFSAAAYEVEPNEGWEQTIEEATDIDSPAQIRTILKDVGPDFIGMDVAYEDKDIGGYGIKRSGKLSLEVLEVIHKSAEELSK